jgi:hypothetical protein
MAGRHGIKPAVVRGLPGMIVPLQQNKLARSRSFLTPASQLSAPLSISEPINDAAHALPSLPIARRTFCSKRNITFAARLFSRLLFKPEDAR